MKPILSVIMPIYNSELYLKQAIDSVLNQTFRDLELILIDDGSTDNSGRICDEYSFSIVRPSERQRGKRKIYDGIYLPFFAFYLYIMILFV